MTQAFQFPQNILDRTPCVMQNSWVEIYIRDQSAHWRMKNEQSLRAAERMLRALHLLAYETKIGPQQQRQIDKLDLSWTQPQCPYFETPTREITDQIYGAGFYKTVQNNSQVLIELTPEHYESQLLSIFLEHQRDQGPQNDIQYDTAGRALERIWNEMNINWSIW
jgi:hypothetical protein